MPHHKSTLSIFEHNLYLLEIREILQDAGWMKCAVDSLWYHPEHGRMHILFAYHKTIKNQTTLWKKICQFIKKGLK